MGSLSLDTIDLHTADLYLTRGYPYEEWDLQRREAPVFWYERDDIDPFWSVVNHEDVLTISKNSDVFVNSRRLRLATKTEDAALAQMQKMRTESRGWDPDEPMDLVFMDDPRHRNFRSVTAKRFTPAAFRPLEPHFAKLAHQFASEFQQQLEEASGRGEVTDFVTGFAEKLPLAVIGKMMDLPDGDWKRLKQLTNVMIGAPDESFYEEGEDRYAAMWRAYEEMTEYLLGVMRERQSRGREDGDLASRIVYGEVDGKKMPEQHIWAYLQLALAAGNETTQNGITGGVAALLEHPDQAQLLVDNADDEDLIVSAGEEILRWTTPVVQFARTAVEDFELSGVKISAGESVGMWYPAANRDPEVFDEPYRFDIARKPNPHLAFGGYGAHFCLGANLARAELRAALRALAPLLPKMELAGQSERCPFLHVPAIHRLEVRASA